VTIVLSIGVASGTKYREYNGCYCMMCIIQFCVLLSRVVILTQVPLGT